MLLAGRRRRRSGRRGPPSCSSCSASPTAPTGGPARSPAGEQQRVAIAVALANRPRVLLADEPTGELDSRSSDEVFGAMRHGERELGTTVVVVTHDAARVASRSAAPSAIRDGRTTSEVLPAHRRRRARRRGRGRRGVRGARPGRPPAAAARVHRRPGAARPGAPRPRGRPHRRLADAATGSRRTGGGAGMTTDLRWRCTSVHRTFGSGAHRGARPARGVASTCGARRARRRARPLRLGQDDPAQRHRRPRPAGRRAGACSTAPTSRR